MSSGTGSKVAIEAPTLPLPIFRLSSRRPKYMLYDIDTVTWLRQTHHILGVQVGGMPQFPQQNIFFGLPLELIPEEARLLVEKGIAYIVDDLDVHNKLFNDLARHEGHHLNTVKSYQQGLDNSAKSIKDEHTAAKAAEVERMRVKRGKPSKIDATWNAARLPWIGREEDKNSPGDTLFESPKSTQAIKPSDRDDSWAITPTTAANLLPKPAQSSINNVNVAASRYAVFKHLHEKGYFMSPGLRFGCQLMVYPGDPLRFHSHFLCNGVGWDEEFDLLDLVGGGRLGTGVKKGFLLGGTQTEASDGAQVRTFCVEWGGL